MQHENLGHDLLVPRHLPANPCTALPFQARDRSVQTPVLSSHFLGQQRHAVLGEP